MNYDLKKPCSNCPFLKADGAVRLGESRIEEIAGAMLSSQGSTFACHKTVQYDDDADDPDTEINRDKQQHCAGALIFAEKNNTTTQAMRWMERIGVYDHKALDKESFPLVFDTLEDMLETAI